MDKFIFLDIDGVLNTANYQTWRQLLGKDISDLHGHLFAPSPVRNLRRLIKWTNAKIVLSSSWRMDGLETMRQMWNERNMPGDIYDITPYVNAREYPVGTRGVEIKKWLNEKGGEGYAFVIIDDIDDFLPEQKQNIVMTNFRRGLTLIKLLTALRILNKTKLL